MTRIRLRDICGVRSGDKGDISDISLFADGLDTYTALVHQVTAGRVAAHFGALVHGPVERHLVPNVLAIKFVLHGALGGGTLSLRSDAQGKTHGLSLLRLWVDLPDELIQQSTRRTRAPLPMPRTDEPENRNGKVPDDAA
jgi:hypothetical protein